MIKDYLNALTELKKKLMKISSNSNNSKHIRNLAMEALDVTKRSIYSELNK